jgi:spermidine synthase
LVHASTLRRVALFGLGTGTDLALLEDAGATDIDVVEPDSATVQLATNELGTANSGALGRPNVHVHGVNPRTFLARGTDRFDLVSVSLASPLSREVVRLATARLNDGGVLVQQIPLHHVSREDILVMVSTVRAELPVVQLFVLGDRGALVGCTRVCEPRSEAQGFLAKRALSATTVDSLWAELQRATGGEPLLSTDDNRFLELAFARADARDYRASLEDNLRWLASFRARKP